MQQHVPELTGGAMQGGERVCGSLSAGAAEGTAGVEHCGNLFLTWNTGFPLLYDFQWAGTAPFFKSHIPNTVPCYISF